MRMQGRLPDGPQLAGPIDDPGEPELNPLVFPEVVLDFTPTDPRLVMNWDAFEQQRVRIAVQLPGDRGYAVIDVDQATREKIAEIGDRYRDVELPQEGAGESEDASPSAPGPARSSPLTKVHDLIQLQQVIEATNALLPGVMDHPWWKEIRPHLTRTNEEYEDIFGRLRDQLRNRQDDGGQILRTLFNTRTTVLVNIGLRLAELEPSLGATIQTDLASLYADDSLDANLRFRAYQELQGGFRRRGPGWRNDPAAAATNEGS